MTTSLRLIAMLCLVQLLATTSPATAQHSYGRGLEYLASGEYRSALFVFDSLLAQQPQNHRLHYLSGLCRYLMADYQGSATAMEMALRGDSLSAQALTVNPRPTFHLFGTSPESETFTPWIFIRWHSSHSAREDEGARFFKHRTGITMNEYRLKSRQRRK